MQKKNKGKIEVYFSGLCEPYNPGGIACYGFVIEQQQQKHTIHIGHGHGLALAEPFTDDNTDNVAAYTAAIKAVEWLLANRPKGSGNNRSYRTQRIVLKGDSQLVINQIKGKRKVKEARIIPLYKKVRSLISKFKNIKIKWIPSEQNEYAGIFSYIPYEQFLDNNPQLYKNITKYMATPKQLELLGRAGIPSRKYRSKEDADRLISKMTKTPNR